MRSHRLLLPLAFSAVLLAGCGSSSNKATGAREVRPIVLTLANWQWRDADVGEWVQAVERLSRGAIKVEVRGGWRHGEIDADRGMLGDVRAGRVDLGHIATRAWDTLGVDSFQALEAPMLVDSLALQERVLTDRLAASMLAGVRAAGVEPVALLPGALGRPIGVSRDLLGPADYRGARLGLGPSALHEATMRALGARAVGVPAVGSLAGLDGTEGDLAGMDFDRVDEQARSVTADVVLWPRTSTLVINRDAWARLTSGQRTVLMAAARAAIGAAIRRTRDFERGGAQSLCDRGFSLARAGEREVAALRGAVEPVYRQLAREQATRRALERIRELKGSMPAASSPACRSDRAQSLPPGAAPLVGTWRVSVTLEQMTAARRLPQEAAEDNWGNLSLVLGADGRFELLNDRYPAPIGLGTWSARGDVLTFTPRGTVEQGAGEQWRFRWTLFRGALELRMLSVAPTALTVAPLHRR